MNLQGKNILVTGGVQGIGRAIVDHLHAAGATLLVTDIQAEGGADLVQALGERVQYFNADVRANNSLEEALAWLSSNNLQLHCAVNNAGVEHAPKPLLECTEKDWDNTIDINLKGVFFCMQQQVKAMLASGGHIINMASVAGIRSAPSLSPYAASKHGVVGLTRSVAVEYARAQIRVNAVCPGIIKTDMMARAFEHMPEHTQKALVNSHPLRRLGTPAEVAQMVGWLCSDESSFITGQCFTIDGGMTA
ncbi:NAD(P)-dependent dehydrogenase, short-chain alcohol dehydrogenase family [Pseudidiomarina planktonica]|uniref:NAD(P)-dependent dehydrogenase, short-chain alcohol dehydrogenase family n=1 Tax=Pseudidiomarina planktonica TaxID=1323738 RepID=A0A1Y6EQF9_9GAMM|nr:glucose 1-dehydrogenase [Pseudidiomarina planktonica]RUO65451.1 3-oxoacyl-ACP reductase [Pseudidiomarina planktonica]SMQ64938.1 NAD(P)-dependent dehydrogenase, short-chain alcohol dehydrogenase family [Pseudidiomarina planktonica]